MVRSSKNGVVSHTFPVLKGLNILPVNKKIIFDSILGPNVARGKPVSQSSTYSGGEAYKAVDGNTNPSRYAASSCSHTKLKGSSQPWWFVDLKKWHYVNNVTIVNRSDGFGELFLRWSISMNEPGTGHRLAITSMFK
jgi:hypothetical protein